MATRYLLTVIGGSLVLAASAMAGAPAEAGSVGATLASRYPNDKGLKSDPAVLFAEDFETGKLDAWDESKGPVQIVHVRPHAGRACVEMPMRRGRDEGGHLIKWLAKGADQVYLRFYVRFSKDYQYPHHFVTLMANPPRDRWRGFGKAGLKPDGTYFSTGMEPWFAWGKNPPPGELHFYSYYPDMEIDRKMNKYWGNGFFPPGPEKGAAAGKDRVIPALDRWQCWEFMVKANSAPDKADGEQAMWLDGKRVARFTGIRWRTDMNTQVNTIWMQHYGYDSSDPTREHWKEQQTVWFDDIVAATRPIGPRAGGGEVKPSAPSRP